MGGLSRIYLGLNMRLIIFFTTILFALGCYSQDGGRFEQLEDDLRLLGVDFKECTCVIVSDAISVENAKELYTAFDKWGMPLYSVKFIFLGKSKILKKKFSPSLFDNLNAIHDKSDIMKSWLDSASIISVIHTEQQKIIKESMANNSNFKNLFIDLKSWSLSSVQFPENDFNNSIKNGSKAPFIDATAISGDSVSSRYLKGNVLVLNFWSDRCASCIVEMPILNRLYDEYKEGKVEFISIYKDSLESLKKYFTFDKPYFNSEFVKFSIIADSQEICKKYGVVGFPYTYIIDQEGKVNYSGGFTTHVTETYDLQGVNSDYPYYYLILKGHIDKLLAKGN
jgi:thiol-disulfide isomerase/thioredoxin